jgi:hypothetical protein
MTLIIEMNSDHKYHCAACGSILTFYSWHKTFDIYGQCPSCGNIYDIDKLEAFEKSRYADHRRRKTARSLEYATA